MPLPLAIFVGADKGGVGKTTLSNALMCFFAERGIATRAWDTESPKGVLKRFHPSKTEIVDLETPDGQMTVFDTLQQSPVTLVDMRAGILSDTVEILHNIGCVRLAQEGLLRLAVFHVIGSSVASFQEIGDIKTALGDAVRHFVVINHHTNDASFFANMKGVSKEALEGSSVVINIPKLTTRAMEFVDASSMPFSDFGRDPNQSFTMRGYVNDWKEKVFTQFDAARLAARD
jgi:hypothetical protein